MIPRRVWYAFLIAVLCHGLFILTARYRMSYDAYTHMLFANHYTEGWFSLWEPRWYTGFTVVSYPPLTHQLIALFIPLLGFDKAFALILWMVTSLYPLGIYAFSRIFTGKTSASYAALASAVLLPIYVTAHIFGQLPFLASTLTALVVAAGLNRYLRDGGIHNFALSVALITTSMALHHATLMVQPFFIFAVVINHIFQNRSFSREHLWILFKRLILFGAASVITSIVVIFPFWQWGAEQTMQTPIDHLSRHNFFTDPLAPAIFFFPLYGPFVMIFPFLARKWHPRFIGLLVLFVILFLLGLGGTIPLPRLFFGDAWEWLTYDRFAFWACLTLTPFFGILFIGLKRRFRFSSKLTSAALRKNLIPALTFTFLTVTALGAWFAPIWFPYQPATVDMQPIVDFLKDDDNSQWRYLTFGFGDQFAHLNLLTEATTIDGSYHTARTLPELRESGIGQVDTAYWALKGVPAIIPILEKSGGHGVRWGFVNPKTLEAVDLRWGKVYRSPFIPVLDDLGWKKITTLSNGVLVYENPSAVPPVNSPMLESPSISSFAWGTFPLLVFVITLSLGMLRLYPIQAEYVIKKIYYFAIGLLPITLCFWLYQTIEEFSHPRVYFTYDHALFFLSDALALLAVLLWLTTRISRISMVDGNESQIVPFNAMLPLFALFLLATISIAWSRDWRTSLYISLHFWLVLLLILSLHDWYEAWKPAMYGLSAALTVQLIAGFAGFALQSTAFLELLNMEWPGSLEPSMRGASVVQLENGLRILRAYGTLPHPNILGGFILIALLGPASLFIADRRRNYPALILFSFGIVLAILTFSRSAWLGLFVFLGLLALRIKHLDRSKIILMVSTMALTAALAVLPLQDFIFTRIGAPTVETETISTVGRSWMTQQALDVIREHPLTGLGIGSFVINVADTAVDGAPIEPVHNIFLLATAELGAAGLIVIVALFASIAHSISRSKSPRAIVAGAVLAGLGVISLFDHYLWTIAPGRVMLGLALGLWAGQVAHDT